MTERVDFWFDPLCPFAWVTSRWILEAAAVRDLDVVWHVMSLGVLNEHKNPSPSEDADQRARWMTSRASTAVAEQYDQETVGRFYTALGTEIHHRDNKDLASAVSRALDELGLDAGIAETAATDANDAAMRASHDEGISKVGQDVGTPIVAFRGTAFFGPVITRVPQGEDAGRLFDASVQLAEFPHFYELKRSRTERPQFD
ncbi:mycothiol-dependent nitroreductase Rv2466c family protein [Nesterenkonia marinintestina]|uniref:mycothiol-dependent nitroreductase Rv2466c family protein n=1 Tax=Nesterenkonia marinintestina TaxID=2979865 RepID=UPI0021C14807|nr:DsbA family protein [Nesterenkonia sp. GX14115]